MIAVQLGAWDWAFMLWFLAVTTGVGLYYARRASKNLTEYFVSGRDLPWWALGTSMVATTFAADTPLAVSGWVIAQGIAKNWIWWSFLFGGTLTVFLFSRWWRRTEVFTEIELIDRRYDGRSARVLRGFKAVYLGLIANAIIFGWVMKAMATIVEVVFGVEPWISLSILLAITLFYTMLSGLWGVVATDVLQFVMAMLGAVLLAVLGVAEVGGLGELTRRVTEATAGTGRDVLAIFPTGWDAFTAGVMILILVNWWAVYYPGAEPGGGGYVAQRMLAAKDENHARAGTLWFIFAHYVLRPWPWILVGLAAIALEPRFVEAAEAASGQGEVPEQLQAFMPERAYPWMFHLLPVGLMGLVVASFFAAFMSTMTTTLNLSASYLVNDLYLPFLARGEVSDRQKVRVARITVLLVAAVGSLVSWLIVSVGEGWTVIMDLTAGTGLVLILRWLWWRVNAWSEISAMLTSAAAFAVVRFTGLDATLAAAVGGPPREVGLVLIVLCTTAVWLVVTLMTRPVGEGHLEAFYRSVRPGGFWRPVAAATGVAPAVLTEDLIMWGAATVMVFGALLGIGSALLLQPATAVVCLAASLGSGLLLRRLMLRS